MMITLDEEVPFMLSTDLSNFHILKYPEMQKVFRKIYHQKAEFKNLESQLPPIFDTVPNSKELFDLVVEYSRSYCQCEKGKIEELIKKSMTGQDFIFHSLMQQKVDLEFQNFKYFRDRISIFIDIIEQLHQSLEKFEKITKNVDKLVISYCKYRNHKQNFSATQLNRQFFVFQILNQKLVLTMLDYVKDNFLKDPRYLNKYNATKQQINNINQFTEQYSQILSPIQFNDIISVDKTGQDPLKSNGMVIPKKEEIVNNPKNETSLKSEQQEIVKDCKQNQNDSGKQKKNKKNKKHKENNQEQRDEVDQKCQQQEESQDCQQKQILDEVKEFERRLNEQALTYLNLPNKPQLNISNDWIKKIANYHQKLITKINNI